MIDPQTVQTWLEQYVAAWQSNDEAQIAALFSVDVVYQFTPWSAPLNGRAAVVEAWRDPGSHDAPGTFEAHYEPVIIEGDTAVTRGTSTYYNDTRHTTVRRQFANVWIVRFDAAGQCREFTEWFFENPAYHGAHSGSA